jgi:putative transposase
LDKLREYAAQFKVAIHAYILMTNHVHLLATPSCETGISQTIQSLGRYYVRYFNKRYRRSGTLWEGRFKSSLIDSDRYFLTVSRYIELNPVRAKMVTHPAHYNWSSFQFNALLKPIKLITPHPLYLELGKTPALRAKQYTSLFESEIPDFKLEEIRGAVNSTRILGSDGFKRQLEIQTGLSLIPNQWGGARKRND